MQKLHGCAHERDSPRFAAFASPKSWGVQATRLLRCPHRALTFAIVFVIVFGVLAIWQSKGTASPPPPTAGA